jgi:hypothetical protein
MNGLYLKPMFREAIFAAPCHAISDIGRSYLMVRILIENGPHSTLPTLSLHNIRLRGVKLKKMIK